MCANLRPVKTVHAPNRMSAACVNSQTGRARVGENASEGRGATPFVAAVDGGGGADLRKIPRTADADFRMTMGDCLSDEAKKVWERVAEEGRDSRGRLSPRELVLSTTFREILIKTVRRKPKVPRLRRIAEKTGNSAALGMTEGSLIRVSLRESARGDPVLLRRRRRGW